MSIPHRARRQEGIYVILVVDDIPTLHAPKYVHLHILLYIVDDIPHRARRREVTRGFLQEDRNGMYGLQV